MAEQKIDNNLNLSCTCRICGRRFMASPPRKHESLPTLCGAKHCEAMGSWTDEQWEGRARMARARAATSARSVANLVDREALRRFP